MNVPGKPFPLIEFSEPDSVEMCKRMSDADHGGFSSANIDFVPASSDDSKHARFHGRISTQLPPDRPEIQRSGYAGWRTYDRGFTLFGKSIWDIDPYSFLALRVKSDGRAYFVNIQTESVIPTDLHQHRLYCRTPGKWETIFIRFDDFVRTNHGLVVEPQSEMLRQKVLSVGLSLIDRIPGPYELCIEGIWATNNLKDGNKLSMRPGTTLEAEAKEKEMEDRAKEPEKILI